MSQVQFHPDMAGVECQYDFTHRERGLAVVIVNKNFPADCGLKNRRGWKKDMTRMKTFFKSLDFRVKCYKDLTGVSMIQKIFKGTFIVPDKGERGEVVVVVVAGCVCVCGGGGGRVSTYQFFSVE